MNTPSLAAAEPPLLLDETFPETRVLFGMARAEVAQLSATRAIAEQWAAIADTLREASDFPDVFVENLRPTDNASELAVRAAAADLAVRLGMTENAVRNHAHEAGLLRTRTPHVWAWFREGEFAVPNARTVADLVAHLPEDAWDAFDTAMAEHRLLAPPRFRARARAVASRLDQATLTERHQRAAKERRVWMEPAVDGMAWLNLHLTIEQCRRAFATIDRMARNLQVPGETRTLNQLRADVAADLLGGVLGSANTRGTGVSIAVTVPVMTLLGLEDTPGTLDGLTPIDADTARRLAGHAPSFTRILTHPITGTVLDIDRNPEHIPADLLRWQRFMHPICDFPGCGRPAAECDIDHTIAKADNGTTTDANVGPLCRNHHRVKHHTKWSLTRDATGITWTSPTGHTTRGDPPPF
ncbi:hypothetical protein HDC94_002073 [Leifsonia sp. AK011]|uniref:HNH endonuclease signature motif containing protein n=1 Tax=Leifsonia sp. AK011 TaxID=2723075 RepID=UPI0015CB50D0|nr:HNH endonuclease signature motif containing protein [Leifsonia sp. AK011]NYF10917.1 hypothetical protein [Leifsonia sp. AK011]